MRLKGFVGVVVLVLVSSWTLARPAAAQVDAWRSQEPVVRYDGDKVVRVEPRNATELEAALTLSDDVWSEGTKPGMPVDLHVTAQQLKRLKRVGLRYTILIDDLQAVVDTESAQLQQAQPLAVSANWHKT
jgi:hypothetical protein